MRVSVLAAVIALLAMTAPARISASAGDQPQGPVAVTHAVLSGESSSFNPPSDPAPPPKTSSSSLTLVLQQPASAGLTINAVLDSSITSNANSAAIQAAISQAVSNLQSLFSDRTTVSILFRYAPTEADGFTPLPSGVLGRSLNVNYFVPWNTFINALIADSKTANDRTANATLPSSALTSQMSVRSALGRAVGLDTPPALDASGNIVNVGTYDSIITLNSGFPFQFTRPVAGNRFDALTVMLHEMNEVLGLGSSIGTSRTGSQDLFSWSAAGVRNVTSSGTRYFSIDGGRTNIVGFNQDPNGDFGDFFSSGPCPHAISYVQDAFGCAGVSNDVSATSPDGINLDVIGYDLVTGGATGVPGPPTSVSASSSGSTATISWGGPASGGAPTSYFLEAGSRTGLTDIAGFDTGSTATSFSQPGVPNGTYFVRVRARNASGTSVPSSEVTLVVGPAACTAAPGAPSGLTLVSNSGGTVVFRWTASSGSPTTYIVEAGSSAGASNIATIDLGGTATTLTANAPRGTYFVRIRGKNACGTGAASNEVTLVVP